MQTRVHIHMRTAKLLHDQLEREKKEEDKIERMRGISFVLLCHKKQRDDQNLGEEKLST